MQPFWVELLGIRKTAKKKVLVSDCTVKSMINKYFHFKLRIIALIILIAGTVPNVSALEGELGDESWTVEPRMDKFFYFTRGTAVWGHEFGFYKDSRNCDEDIFWLTFSSTEEKVKDFIGQDVEISLNVDGKDFRVKLPMLDVYDPVGLTKIMMFTNWHFGRELMNALINGHDVTVKIMKPKELKELMDIKEDKFSLAELKSSRKQSMSACRQGAQTITEIALIRFQN